MIYDKQYYLDTFKVTKEQLDALIATALGGGGTYADLFFENTSSTDLMLRDGAVASGGFNVDYGVGVRTLLGEKTGYAYAESTDPAAMRAAALSAAAIGAAGSRSVAGAAARSKGEGALQPGPAAASIAGDDGYVPRLYRGQPNPAADRYPFLQNWNDRKPAELSRILYSLDEKLRSADKRVLKVMAVLSYQTSDILIYNSYEELKYETRPMGTVAVSAILSDGKNVLNCHSSRSFRKGAEMITDSLTDELCHDILRNIDDKFAAGRPKGGKMPVVMGAGASGILLHEAMGHAFEADFIRKGQSIFEGRLGSKICNENITIVDDGTIKGNRGSINFDDEGVPAQRTVMVDKGVLTSFLHDRISARALGVQPTGNGRRENFRCAPIPRMRATYMESGPDSSADIISSVKKGIYVDEFSNGQVKIGEGDFTFYVKSGYLIENGHLTAPVKDINIIGNGPQALSDIVAVGCDAKIDDGAWTCGKEQSVPVSCGIPTVLVGGLTVGGE
ncbi:MAG: TldD/PmbA family protein [Bacteroidales bacterium]|nr:TldD/PmbA family protein [Bacteroidales bacterium]